MKTIKNGYCFYVYLAFLISFFTGAQGMDTLYTTLAFLNGLPQKMSSILTSHSIFAYRGLQSQTFYANNAAQQRIHQANAALQERINQVDQIAQQRIHQVKEDSREVADEVLNQGTLYGVAGGSILIGSYFALSNIDHDKKPEQSSRKFWAGTALAVFNTGYLYKKYRDIQQRKAQRAANNINPMPATPQNLPSSSLMTNIARTTINPSTAVSTSTTTSTTSTSLSSAWTTSTHPPTITSPASSPSSYGSASTSITTTLSSATTPLPTTTLPSTSLTAFSSSSNRSTKTTTSTPTPFTILVLTSMAQTTTTSSPHSLSRRNSSSNGSSSTTLTTTQSSSSGFGVHTTTTVTPVTLLGASQSDNVISASHSPQVTMQSQFDNCGMI